MEFPATIRRGISTLNTTIIHKVDFFHTRRFEPGAQLAYCLDKNWRTCLLIQLSETIHENVLSRSLRILLQALRYC